MELSKEEASFVSTILMGVSSSLENLFLLNQELKKKSAQKMILSILLKDIATMNTLAPGKVLELKYRLDQLSLERI